MAHKDIMRTDAEHKGSTKVHATQKKNTGFQRIRIFNTPIANIAPESIRQVIDDLITRSTPSQIIFLSWWELIRAICKQNYKSLVKNTTLVIPTSPLISFSARVLKKDRLHYHASFDFIITVLSRIEAHNKSIYLLGMELEQIQAIEKNIKNTFPHLMVVGRYSGYFSIQQEQAIITAIRKSDTTLLFVGNGVPQKELWPYRIKHKIKPCISVWSGSTMDVLSSKIQKPPSRGIRLFFYSIKKGILKPWRVYRLFVFLWYFGALLYCRIFNKH